MADGMGGEDGGGLAGVDGGEAAFGGGAQD